MTVPFTFSLPLKPDLENISIQIFFPLKTSGYFVFISLLSQVQNWYNLWWYSTHIHGINQCSYSEIPIGTVVWNSWSRNWIRELRTMCTQWLLIILHFSEAFFVCCLIKELKRINTGFLYKCFLVAKTFISYVWWMPKSPALWWQGQEHKTVDLGAMGARAF